MKQVVLWLVLILASARVVAQDKPNVLLIMIDDLNDWVGFLGGHPQAKTPNMDALAAKGVSFTNAHCSAPACSPSRLSMLFGVEPFHSGYYPFYNLSEIEGGTLDRYVSLPMLFRQSGYTTFGAGKVHHRSKRLEGEWDEYGEYRNVPLSLDAGSGYVKKSVGDTITYDEAGYLSGNGAGRVKMTFCPTKNPLEDHHDYQAASFGVDVLSREMDEPFFLAVGFIRPHLPLVCPPEFFEMHEGELAENPVMGDDLEDVPWVGRSMAKIDMDESIREDEAWEQVQRAYLACVSWVDFNVGRVLDALEESGHADNTVVVLVSDHGFHLGEKRSFTKFSLWEEATRVPFMIYDPRPDSGMVAGERAGPVSLVNVYKTVAELAGVEAPGYLDGFDLAPWLREPERVLDVPVVTSWGRGNYSVRDDAWRYTRYFDGSEELYSHADDPNEWTNLAAKGEHAAVKERLAGYLPAIEAPLVREGLSIWNTVDADQPELDEFKALWAEINRDTDEPLDRAERMRRMGMLGGGVLVAGVVLVFAGVWFRRRRG